MRKFVSALATIVLTFTLSAFAVPYPHVQSDAVFGPTAAGSHTVSVRIQLHNTGDIAASCVIKLGGRKQVTGVSANGYATVSFDGVRTYKGYTVACSVD